MDIETVGVIGAGVMGVGVAQATAQVGLRTVLIDIDSTVLDAARDAIFQQLRFACLFDKEASVSDPEEVLGRIVFTTDLDLLCNADFVIENVTEKWQVKQEVYSKLAAICPDHCIFAANTSAISITRIASVAGRVDRTLGMHFMNPVPMKPLVEVIRGFHTSEETIEVALGFLTAMGKEGVVVNDYPGFVSNRVLMLTINEAIFLIQDQVSSTEDVDKIFRSCFDHKMGPLETADLIGLDTILYSLEVLYESYNDSKFRPAPLLKKMVDAGLHGRKSGQGFYIHSVTA